MVEGDMAAHNGAAAKPKLTPRKVAAGDLLDVLALGLRDFRRAPLYGLFFAGIYVAGGWLLILLLVEFDLPYLVYPLAAGFALIAPFIAAGFYVVSQKLESGDTPGPGATQGRGALSWRIALGTVKSMFGRELGWLALVTGFSLFIWLDIAVFLSFGFMGFRLFGFAELIDMILNTPQGWMFLAVGNAAGALIAFGVFSYSVLSIPILFERDVDFVTAMVTSVRFVVLNLKVMAAWCIVIALLTGLSLLSGLIGLLFVLPILGHASWHLYRRALPPP